MAAPFQFLVHLVQQHVGQQRRDWATLRRFLVSLHRHPVVHYPNLKVSSDQPQYGFVLDTLRQSVHKHVVVDPIKELLQVNINHDPVTVLHMALRFKHGVMRKTVLASFTFRWSRS